MTNQDIINIVLRVTELESEAVFSRIRITELVKARQFIHYFAFRNVKQKLWDIADLTGHSHATVVNSIKRIRELDYNKWQPFYGMKKEIQHKINVLENSKLKTHYLHCKYSTQFYIT